MTGFEQGEMIGGLVIKIVAVLFGLSLGYNYLKKQRKKKQEQEKSK